MWRHPGQSYEVELDGLKIKCLPLSRARRKEILAGFVEFGESMDPKERIEAVDSLYELAIAQIETIGGVDDVREFIECQTTDQVNRFLDAVVKSGSLTEDETKNSKSSSDA